MEGCENTDKALLLCEREVQEIVLNRRQCDMILTKQVNKINIIVCRQDRRM